ncbi:MAG: trypsin-like peptidase domain-containing protein [Oscillospiraceae bacterium]|nr:trypsin-like peptidase domain-containing protein [Oscillospiraceae bacterium]
MDQFPEKDEQTPETPPVEDSSYRYSRESFTDASYIPHDQAPRTPRTHAYTEPELRENRRSWEAEERRRNEKPRRGMGAGAVIALCLVCVLVGALAGLFGSAGYSALQERRATVETPVPAPTDSPAAEEAIIDNTPTVPATERPYLAPDTEINEQLAATEVYDRACLQVVGISTEVTYQSHYGTQSSTVTGSGFIIDESGYILTNHHVVEYAAEGGYPITVMLYNGDSYPAVIVGYEDDDSDVAVLKIEASGLSAAKLGDSNSIRVGETIYAVGNPLGELDYTMTKGMISAMDREITTTSDSGTTSTINMFQIDAAVNSGNSGGPVYNGEGEVIGIVTAKYSDTYAEMGIEGLGFAIPIDDALNIANDLIQNGYVRGKAYLGISTKSVSSAAAQYFGMVEGAYVYAIVEGSCAETAGLKMGDIITAVDRFPVASVSDLQSALKNYAAGDSAELSISRSGEELKLQVVFDEKQPQTEAVQAPVQEVPQNNNAYGYYYGGFPW